MSKGVAITGAGVISAIGHDLAANHANLLNGISGVRDIEHVETVHQGKLQTAEVNLTNDQLATYLELPSGNSFSRTAMIGLHAARQALAHAGIENLNEVRTGLISATSVGGMDMTEQYFYNYVESVENRRYIASHHAGASTQQIAAALGLEKALTTTISTACSSGANAIMHGARLIKAGLLDRVIVGGTDCLSKFTLNGFNSLMILSDQRNTPFDDRRKGLNLGEGAAYLILESDTLLAEREDRILGYVKGYGNANDAHHQTASSENGNGATAAMLKALEVAQLDPIHIDHVNAHGTATVNNDLSEGRALIRVFGQQVPAFTSTKAFTGHTLAAAGAIEAVYSLLSIKHGQAFPTLGFEQPMKEFDLRPCNTLTEMPIDTIMSNSFGFGGNCSTLILSRSA